MLQCPLDSHEDWAQPAEFSPDDKHIMSGLVLEKQHLTLFSPHPEHALIDVIEFLHDITSQSQHKLEDLVKVSNSR